MLQNAAMARPAALPAPVGCLGSFLAEAFSGTRTGGRGCRWGLHPESRPSEGEVTWQSRQHLQYHGLVA